MLIIVCVHNFFLKYYACITYFIIFVTIKKDKWGMKPEETIDFHIRWAWFNISRMYNIEAAKYGGSMAIGYTLLNIDTKEGTPSTKLAPKMGMESRSLTRMIKSLEEKGVIYKKVDENDRRMVRLFLTDLGQDMRNQAISSVLKFNEKVQGEIPREDLEKTFEVLGKLNQIIDRNNIFNNNEIDK